MSAPLPAAGVSTLRAPLRAGRALWILAMYVVMQVTAGVLVGFVVGFYVAINRGAPFDTGSATGSVTDTAGAIATMPAAVAGAFLGGLLALRMSKRAFRRSPPEEFYQTVGWSRASRREILSSILVGMVLSGSYLLVACLLLPPQPADVWHPFSAAVSSGGWPRHTFAFLALLLAPPVEEFVFRGVVFAGLLRSWRLPAAALVTTTLFVLMHVASLNLYWPGLVGIAVIAIATLRARIVTNSLAPCIAMHSAYNLGLVVAIYAGAI